MAKGRPPLAACVRQDELKAGLAFVRRSIHARSRVPLLSGVLLDPYGGGMTLAGTDYETGSTYEVAAPGSKGRAVLVSARMLADIVRLLPKGCDVELAENGEVLRVRAGGPASMLEYRLPLMAGADYPTVPTAPPGGGTLLATLTPGDLAQLAALAAAAGTDDTLPVLTAIALVPEGGQLTGVATDRYRLAVRRTRHDVDPAPFGPKGALLAPARMLAVAASTFRSCREIRLVAGQGAPGLTQLWLQAADRTLSLRLIESTFPDWQQLIRVPDDVTRVTVGAGALALAVRQAAVSIMRGMPVLFHADTDGLVITAGAAGMVDPTVASSVARVTLPAAKLEGEPVEIAFNPWYLLAGLGMVPADAEVTLTIVSGQKPAVMTCADDDGLRYAVMPVKLAATTTERHR